MSTLLQLPQGSVLKPIATFIKDSALYPDADIANFGSVVVVGCLAQDDFDFGDFGGLGLNTNCLLLMPTGFGKESFRKSILEVVETVLENAPSSKNTKVIHQIPISPQALHRELENNSSLVVASDEIADYLLGSEINVRQSTVAYLTEVSTRSFGKISPPQSISGQYKEVERPRVSIIATATPERMVHAFTPSQADAGAYNRMIIFCKQEALNKNYNMQPQKLSDEIIEFGQWLLESAKLGKDKKGKILLQLSASARAKFIEIDRQRFEPEKALNPRFAARLAEQTFRLAAIVALSCRRLTITEEDLEWAANYRWFLYEQFIEFLNQEGGINHNTNRAFEQLEAALQRHRTLPLSRLKNYSRAFEGLNVPQQRAVEKALIDRGIATQEEKNRGYLLRFTGDDRY